MGLYCFVSFAHVQLALIALLLLLLVFVRDCCCFVYLLSQHLENSSPQSCVEDSCVIRCIYQYTTYSCACTATTKVFVSQASTAIFYHSVTCIFLNPSQARKDSRHKQRIFTDSFFLVLQLKNMSYHVCFCSFPSSNAVHELFQMLLFGIQLLK